MRSGAAREGWPGERMVPEAAASRVYTAVRELRAMGLRPVLDRRAEGYLLDPVATVTVDEAPDPGERPDR